MSSILGLERKQKNYSNAFGTGIFLFRFYSFAIETINTFIHSRSSLKNHTRFRIKQDATERTLGFVKVKLINRKRGGKVRNEMR